ncbi:portal capsid protein Q (GpQ) [Escherichia coli]|uniref:Portal capsid protein Q (GpQ) n=1 Tax=Escherichia coli TaxID=562 RepID=A0A376KHV8_ECOLX|nr:portal capsid protein Q (GpQ) [Escherichia coli]
MLGEPLKLRHALAKYMRRGSDLESWWYVQDGKDAFQFRRWQSVPPDESGY